jgi:uncharacterized surface protein with fasciclin (FAS1) repeats
MKKVFGIIAVLSFLLVGCSNQTNSPVAPDNTLEKKPGELTIVEIASSNPAFSYLVQAVVLTDLVDALSSNRQLTVFAPVNSAFEQLATDLGYASVAELLVPANKDLVKAVLLYHVAPGVRYAKNVLASEKTITLNGQFAYVKVVGEDAYIGNETKYAKILTTDIRAKNGVIHVIDSVILPQ